MDNPFEELKELKQTGTMDEYIEEFELFSLQCGRLPEVQFLGNFLGGLHQDIQSRVRTFGSRSKPWQQHGGRFSKSNWAPRDNGPSGFSGLTQSSPTSASGKNRTHIGPNSASPSTGKSFFSSLSSKGSSMADQGRPPTERNRGFKHLSYSEEMDRRAKGLCFSVEGVFTHSINVLKNNQGSFFWVMMKR